MKNLKTIGRYLFTVPFAMFGLMHLFMAKEMAGVVPSWLPGGVFWVYILGLALLAAATSFIIQKHTYLAGLLTAALLVIFILTVFLPDLLGGNQMALGMIFKEIGLAGGALLLASNYQQD